MKHGVAVFVNKFPECFHKNAESCCCRLGHSHLIDEILVVRNIALKIKILQSRISVSIEF